MMAIRLLDVLTPSCLAERAIAAVLASHAGVLVVDNDQVVVGVDRADFAASTPWPLTNTCLGWTFKAKPVCAGDYGAGVASLQHDHTTPQVNRACHHVRHPERSIVAKPAEYLAHCGVGAAFRVQASSWFTSKK